MKKIILLLVLFNITSCVKKPITKLQETPPVPIGYKNIKLENLPKIKGHVNWLLTNWDSLGTAEAFNEASYAIKINDSINPGWNLTQINKNIPLAKTVYPAHLFKSNFEYTCGELVTQPFLKNSPLENAIFPKNTFIKTDKMGLISITIKGRWVAPIYDITYNSESLGYAILPNMKDSLTDILQKGRFIARTDRGQLNFTKRSISSEERSKTIEFIKTNQDIIKYDAGAIFYKDQPYSWEDIENRASHIILEPLGVLAKSKEDIIDLDLLYPCAHRTKESSDNSFEGGPVYKTNEYQDIKSRNTDHEFYSYRVSNLYHSKPYPNWVDLGDKRQKTICVFEIYYDKKHNETRYDQIDIPMEITVNYVPWTYFLKEYNSYNLNWPDLRDALWKSLLHTVYQTKPITADSVKKDIINYSKLWKLQDTLVSEIENLDITILRPYYWGLSSKLFDKPTVNVLKIYGENHYVSLPGLFTPPHNSYNVNDISLRIDGLRKFNLSHDDKSFLQMCTISTEYRLLYPGLSKDQDIYKLYAKTFIVKAKKRIIKPLKREVLKLEPLFKN